MKTPRLRWTVVAACAVVSACATSRTPSTDTGPPCLVDLTHAYDEDTVYWPTSPSRFEKETLFYGHTDRGYFYSAYTIATPEHGGTHLDAPIHFAEGQDTAEAVALERLVAPAVVIDIQEAATSNPDALLQTTDIEEFEAAHGRIRPGTIVLVRTGWAARWPDVERYLGDDTPGDASKLHFPGISESAARTLVERDVAAVGIDTASLDHGPSKDFVAHRVLMEAGIPGFENVADLTQVPPRGARVIALPMKIAGGSGAPLRIVVSLPGSLCEAR